MKYDGPAQGPRPILQRHESAVSVPAQRPWSKRPYGPVFALVFFLLSLWGLHMTLADFRYVDVVHGLQKIDAQHLLWALALTGMSYFASTAYDALALRYVGRPAPYKRLALAAFIGAAFRSNAGFPTLDGGNLRDRLYSGWPLAGQDVTRVLLFCAVTYWLGLTFLGGIAFILESSSLSVLMRLPVDSLRPVGILLIAATFAYLLLAASQNAPQVLRNWDIPLPGVRVALAQIAVAALDWAAAGAALYVLLPASLTISFPDFVSVFLICQTVGVLSPVPGGLGVFELVFIFLLAPHAPAPELFAAALAYRMVYQLLPIGIAAVLLVARERLPQAKAIRRAGSWAATLVPHVLAVATFLAGTVLLLSGAMPGLTGRLAMLATLIPLPVLEASHFLSSIIGAALIILARGIQRRLDTAYWFTAGLLCAGIVSSVLKGLSYEEALLLGILLAALASSRQHFWRKGSLVSGDFGPGWIAAIVAAFAGAMWIAAFAYKNVEYNDELWWRFLLADSVPRSLRATAGAMCVALLYGVATLFRPARVRPTRPTPDELAKARGIVAQSARISAHRALLGDKMLLFNAAGTAFLMYGIEGDSWIALGDPVGPDEEMAELVWAFREMCDRYAGRLVFYQVEEDYLSLYVDLGLTIYKLGEEGHVPLPTFALEGGERRGLRQAHNRAARAGLVFEVLPATAVDALLPELKTISDAWLEEKHTREKGFSVGYFDAAYLRRFPAAVVRLEGRIVAFANVLCSAGLEELSLDLIRARPEAPYGVMEFMVVELMLWGRQQGYVSFNLGMAPLSGVRGKASARLWNRFGEFIFHFGEHFYNFKGVRDFKEQFHPQWTAKYIAAGSGLMLPRAIADVAALIAGGYRGVVFK